MPVTQDDLDENARQLKEEVPWCISAVLQDSNFFNNLNVKGLNKMCVADTGYGLGHQDLPSGNDVIGKDAKGKINEKWSTDGGQHGTHCAGTIGATGDNGKGVVGVIPNNKGGNFQLVIGKALSKEGSGSASAAMKAIQGCVDQGANVISMSFGCSNCKNQTEEMFFKNLYSKDNILLIAAAGNDRNSAKGYPASYKDVMSVASLTSQLKRSSFSQYNDQIEISGPGSGIKSTIPGDKYALGMAPLWPLLTLQA